MQCTLAASIPKTLASSPRSGNTPWLCVHTVSFASCPLLSHTATAQDGPIEPWHW